MILLSLVALLIAIAIISSGTLQSIAELAAFAILLYLLIKRSRSTREQ